MRNTIGKIEIDAAYEVARKVYHRDMIEKEAVDELVQTHGMNRASASDYVRNLTQMLNGFLYHRTLSQLGTEIYFNRILTDYGRFYLEKAITATLAHLEYYEAQPKGGRLSGIAKICKRFKSGQLSSAILTIEAINEEFQLAVEDALADNSAARRERLKNAPPKPKRRIAQHFVYIRNPDVVAEVLSRAEGNCEKCKRKAPFKKKKDNSNYLEAHHRIPFTEGGEDTVKNAIALCPNCHREAHFGINWEKFRE